MASLMVRLATRDAFLACLKTASESRDERWEMVDGPYGSEAAWVGYEAEQMLTLINEIRAEHRQAPADIGQVRRIEQSACGHVDYPEKYALRCAFLALGE